MARAKTPKTQSSTTVARAAASAATPADPGYITVRVGKLPGLIEMIALDGGRTVRCALEGAGLEAGNYQIRVNGAPATMETEVCQDDTVLLVRQVRGNTRSR